MQNGNFCSGSADTTIKIWDAKNKSCLQTLHGHERWVKCVFELENGILLSGSDDNTIKIWEMKPEQNDKYRLIKTIKEHNHAIRTFCQIDRKHFASGCFDSTIKVWEIGTWICVETLVGHTSNIIGIIYLKMNGRNTIISISNDKTIRIWEKDIDNDDNL